MIFREVQSQPADVLLLAAGYGKRLRPLTDTIPKPLIEIGGRALIVRHLERLATDGFRRVFVNLHYRGEQIREALGTGERWGLQIEYSEESVLLDTGGAIANISGRRSGELLLTINSDSLFGDDFSYLDIIAAHQAGFDKPIATMCVRQDSDAKSYGSLGMSEQGAIIEFLGVRYRTESVIQEVMFAGIQVLTRRCEEYMPAAGSVFSSTRDTLVKMLSAGEFVRGYCYAGAWSDVGTPERLAEASANFR